MNEKNMNEADKDKHELGTYVDLKIGEEHKENQSEQLKTSYFEDEMLIMTKKQTKYLQRINSIAIYFFFSSVISVIFVIINIFS